MLLDLMSSHLESLPLNFGPGGWVNGNNFIQSTEAFGILPLPMEQHNKLSMLIFNPQFATGTKLRHRYLAEKQNTRIAVLPVHTKSERLLFKALLLSPQGSFAAADHEPNWQDLAREWNTHGDGREIFYKVCYTAKGN
jgi:hypothetical protein